MNEESKNNKKIVAICYDFDETLSPKNMTEYGLLQRLNVDNKTFWKSVDDKIKKHGGDLILTYLHELLHFARLAGIELSIDDFVQIGKQVELFQGLQTWFERINATADSLGICVEHYVISCGIKEVIENTPIAKYFKAIYASNFAYDQDGRVLHPNTAVNFTHKTQYLYRINKNHLDASDEWGVHAFMPESERRVPFGNMVYIGDSMSDIPCMSLLSSQGGYSICVFNPSDDKHTHAHELLQQHRIQFHAKADYNKGSKIDNIINTILHKIKIEQDLAILSKQG